MESFEVTKDCQLLGALKIGTMKDSSEARPGAVYKISCLILSIDKRQLTHHSQDYELL